MPKQNVVVGYTSGQFLKLILRISLRVVLVALLLLKFNSGFSQTDTLTSKLLNSFNVAVNKKLSKSGDELERLSTRGFSKVLKSHDKLRQSLLKADPVSASIIETYARDLEQLAKFYGQAGSMGTNTYIPLLDSLNVSTSFLHNVDVSSSLSNKSIESLTKVKSLIEKNSIIRDRLVSQQVELENMFRKMGKLKELAKINKQINGFKSELDMAKAALNNPNKAISTVLNRVSRIKGFKSYFNKQSELSRLFSLNDVESEETKEIIPGLQTVAMVDNILTEKSTQAGRSVKQMIEARQRNTSPASEVTSRLSFHNYQDPAQVINTGTDLPKRKRLEFITDFQTVRSNGFFPTTTDFGLRVGYRLKNSLTFGVGGSYKMGWGDGFQKIKITHQGIGLRSFIDFKIKGAFYMSGGAEMNYRNQINEVQQLMDLSAWQQSALIGLTRKMVFSKKIKGQVQLLYDFLYSQQIPITQPLLFRIGYKL